jgi:uncharacterized protein
VGELRDLPPLDPKHLPQALGQMQPGALIEHWTAWGGVPRYWELAASVRGSARDRVSALVLDPLGALFSEPERLLLEEVPSAIELRPILDAVGAGAHRLSEIAARIGRPATSLARPLDRLTGIGLIRRETPHGEPTRGGKRSLYKIDDCFMRLWFRIVAPNRAALVAGTPASRRALLDEHWDALAAQAWEDLCRRACVTISRGALARLGPWRPATRYWHGSEPEWDLVAVAIRGRRTLLGEAWFSRKPVTAAMVQTEARRLASRAPPPIGADQLVRALFVPSVAAGTPRVVDGVHVVTLRELLA